jgi:hypothetical protein
MKTGAATFCRTTLSRATLSKMKFSIIEHMATSKTVNVLCYYNMASIMLLGVDMISVNLSRVILLSV